MPKYFFDIDDWAGVVEDVEGTELDSLELAKWEAINDLLALASESLRQRKRLPLSRRILIYDEQRRILAHVSFIEALSALR